MFLLTSSKFIQKATTALLYNSGFGTNSMSDTTIHPSIKPLIPYYLFSGLLFVMFFTYLAATQAPFWYPVFVPVSAAIYAGTKHLISRTTKLVIEGDLIKYESGIASKQQRTIVIQKLQDVRVDQSIFERILGIGSLTLETAGETSRLTIDGIDNPGTIAAMLHEKMQRRSK